MVETAIKNEGSLKTAKNTDAAVLLSGGIDSAVMLGLLIKEGLRPERIKAYRFKLWSPEGEVASECTERHEIQDAKDVADHFGVDFYPLYWEKFVYDSVFSPAFDGYFSGITPNPDLDCNEKVKFGVFADFALNQLGAPFVATGHHVRRRDNPFRLLVGKDSRKDQSYFLATTKRKILEHSRFPVGEYLKDKEVRGMASDFGLPDKILKKRSSRDWCFIAKNQKDEEDNPSKISLEQLLMREGKMRGKEFCPGPIIDGEGRVVGQHNGVMLYAYTLGQKVGYKDGFGVAGGFGRRYLVGRNIKENTLYVGSYQPQSSEITVRNLNWLTETELSFPLRCSAKIRTPQEMQPCFVEKTGEDEIRVKFDTPQNSVAPGQACVLYDGEVVLGGGIIVS